jgi:hypothetical protein
MSDSPASTADHATPRPAPFLVHDSDAPAEAAEAKPSGIITVDFTRRQARAVLRAVKNAASADFKTEKALRRAEQLLADTLAEERAKAQDALRAALGQGAD